MVNYHGMNGLLKILKVTGQLAIDICKERFLSLPAIFRIFSLPTTYISRPYQCKE